jgi:hypothetical protein
MQAKGLNEHHNIPEDVRVPLIPHLSAEAKILERTILRAHKSLKMLMTADLLKHLELEFVFASSRLTANNDETIKLQVMHSGFQLFFCNTTDTNLLDIPALPGQVSQF